MATYGKKDAADELSEEMENKKDESQEESSEDESSEDENSESSSGMVSMKRDKEEKKEAATLPEEIDDYAYGLRIELDKDSLEKLGFDKLPKVGAELSIEAKVEVVSTGQNAGRDGDSKNMSLQITEMKCQGDK